MHTNSCMEKTRNTSVIVHALSSKSHSYILYAVRTRVTGVVLVKFLNMGNSFLFLFKIVFIPRRIYVLMFQLTSTLLPRSCVSKF
jgi:hypothetical protein